MKYMKSIYKITQLIAITALFIACSSKGDSNLQEKKAALSKLKSEQTDLEKKIKTLESEIEKLDSSFKKILAKQVAVEAVAPANFSHYIDLQGKIDAEDISIVTPRGMGGQVKQLLVQKGDLVKKGQLLVVLDDAIIQQNIKQLTSQLDFAKNIFQRQKNLWEQGIGTEVQYLTSKNNVDALERQLDVIKEQSSTTRVYAQVNGIADEVNVRVGEFFQGMTALGQPQIKIVNNSRLKAVVDVPESYLAKVKKGTKVKVIVPELEVEIIGDISVISQSINQNSRGFLAEIHIPANNKLKPNLIAQVKILDYAVSNILTIPLNLIQSDEHGKFVYVTETKGNKIYAKKLKIEVGESYEGRIEVKAGLASGDQIITEGFQGLYEGQLIETIRP